ncbi:putative HTH-type transcriptional regulator YdfH [Falsiruegeria litorea R37]|uniref:Putative HTH-type transcriptional regulator YdfH n=1 Tax=Falsiruegeria litorea R37 TaxID=1200284 RepID=A0A1Y5SE07_9RHOB|nr:GntR family transcriptional regulator [Falsiruegeria litorea]SLN35499.1 putative HTH-type transcriptional regulator YdfH [Falsiruegeria litorea R37]
MSSTQRKESSSASIAYARMLDDIRTGTLQAGDRVTETELATRLELSRTPVREAIRMLEADGLVEHVPRVGATIRKLGYAEVMELYDMRAVLEGTAARMAARTASDIELAELDALNADMATCSDLNQAYHLNRQFHLTLLDAAKNRFLLKSMAGLQRTLLILGPIILSDPTRAAASVEEHEAILRALRARDADAAEAAMRAHIEAGHRKRLRLLRDERRLTPQAEDVLAEAFRD